MISTSEPCDNFELQYIRSDLLPIRNIPSGVLSEMSVEPRSVAALLSEGNLIEEQDSLITSSTGKCLTCLASGVEEPT
jgi:hypothetical protein